MARVDLACLASGLRSDSFAITPRLACAFFRRPPPLVVCVNLFPLMRGVVIWSIVRIAFAVFTPSWFCRHPFRASVCPEYPIHSPWAHSMPLAQGVPHLLNPHAGAREASIPFLPIEYPHILPDIKQTLDLYTRQPAAPAERKRLPSQYE